MSTKTTIKRIALVSVAALSLGVLSVAPSNAAAQLDSLNVSATSTTQVAGDTLTATSVVATASLAGVKTDTLTVTATIKSGPAYIAPKMVLKETSTATTKTTGTGSAVVTVISESTTITQGTASFSVYLDAPTVVGTYVVLLTPTGNVNAVAREISIVVSAKTLGWNTAFIGNGTSVATADATAATLTYTALPSTTAKASIAIKQGYGATAGSNGATNADAAAVVVTTDKGLLSKSTLTYADSAKSVSFAAATLADSQVYIYSNGDVGAATITITVGGVALTSKKVTFTGAATTLVATPTTATPIWATLGTDTTTVITSTDSAGSVVTSPATVPTGLTVKSSDTAVATVTIHATDGTVTIKPVAAGNAIITVTDPATSAAATAVSFPVHVAPVKSKVAPVISFDKPSYNVGELVTMTITSDMGDSATANLFTAALVGSAAVTTTEAVAYNAGATHKLVGGKVTYKFYAPAVSGSWTVTGTAGADVDLTTLVTAPVVTKSIDIVNPGVDAATTAAEAAEAAAQDATDAALDATTAAEAAGALAQEAVDLVTELSAEVTKLMTALKAQITYLTKLVMKLAAK